MDSATSQADVKQGSRAPASCGMAGKPASNKSANPAGPNPAGASDAATSMPPELLNWSLLLAKYREDDN